MDTTGTESLTRDDAPSAPRRPGPALGLVMGGGGARAAYQVGFLRCLARRYPQLQVPYITGVSAGAINAAHLASHHGTFAQAVAELTALWSNLTVADVFRVDTGSLARNVARWGMQLVAGTGRVGNHQPRALVDTEPLRSFLTESLHAVGGELTGIQYNLTHGRLRAVALSTASYTTGQSVTWVQGHEISEWERPNRVSRITTLTVEHVMASAALPLFFPAVKVGNAWYGDGGMRLISPLSPALNLGANRIVAISTRYNRSTVEADAPLIRGYPPPAQILGVLMNSIFLDMLDQDAWRLERLNRLIGRLEPHEREGLRPVELLMIRPSQDLGKLANEYEAQLPRTLRFLTRNLGTKETLSPDSLSMILFQPDYLKRMIEIGEQDAEARGGEIEQFMNGVA